MIAAWLLAFLFTQAVEVPVYALALRPRPWPSRLLVAFGASALTHPVVWWLVLGPFRDHYDLGVVVAETFAVAGEALYLHLFRVRRALLWALAANAASVVLGQASRALWGLP